MPKIPNKLSLSPVLGLRVSFAGSAQLPADTRALAAAMESIFHTLAQRLDELAPDAGVASEVPTICRYYAAQNPVLRLITGLCEGADSLAVEVFDRLKQGQHLRTELAAVIPFDLPVYRASRPADFRVRFDEQAQRCAYILSLDGLYEKPSPDTELAKWRRARAYRAQAALLLRQADLLIAAVDEVEAGRAGGTLETVRSALAFGLPVVLINPASGVIRLVSPEDDLLAVLSAPISVQDKHSTDVTQRLREWVTVIVADPATDSVNAQSAHGTEPKHAPLEHELLAEFFQHANTPPLRTNNNGQLKRRETIRERCWAWCERRFRRTSDRSVGKDDALDPYLELRERATALNYHYIGLYRGTFLLNFGLAALAVALAATSLALLPAVAAHNHVAGLVVMVLGALKLSILMWIFFTTHQATKGEWAEKAVDYRYLAERLRSLYYLPRLGSFQPPAPQMPHYAARAVRQSAVDWLFEALLRSVSPVQLARRTSAGSNEPLSEKTEFCFADSNGPYAATVLKPEPQLALDLIERSWISQQANYHDRNSRVMQRISSAAETVAKAFNLAVIGIVLIDLLLLGLDSIGWLESWVVVIHRVAPWLVVLTAVLPAAVASLNGIRFQSECSRLADRSAMMRTLLEGSETMGPSGSKLGDAQALRGRINEQFGKQDDPGSWVPEVLRLAESTADVLAKEVAEWSVLYAKEVPEP